MAVFVPFLLLIVGLALLLRVDLYFTVVWFLVGVYALSRGWTQRTVQHLRVRRQFEDHAFTGDEITVDLIVYNTGRIPVPWLELDESVPLPLREEPFPAEVVSLGPHAEKHSSYKLQCRKRGYYEIGPLRVQTGDVLGIEHRILMVEEPRHITVYPRVVPMNRLGLPTRSALVALPSRVPLFEDTTRIMGVREYQPGDSPRRIHWTATARSGGLVVKQFQPAMARETLLFLDQDLRDYDVRHRHDATELAIVVAASLAQQVIVRENLPVGLVTEGVDAALNARRRFVLPPRSEQTHLMRILEVLARVQASGGESFASLLQEESARLSWGSTIVVITGSIDERMAETMLYLKRGGHAVALILVQAEQLQGQQGVPGGIRTHRVWNEADLAVV